MIKKSNILSVKSVEFILKTAIKEAKKNNFNISVTVVDRSGTILGVLRDENAGVHTLNASFKKAYTASSQKRSTDEIFEKIKKGDIPNDILTLDGNLTSMRGGLPIVINNEVIGGVGIGGAHGEKDTSISKFVIDE